MSTPKWAIFFFLGGVQNAHLIFLCLINVMASIKNEKIGSKKVPHGARLIEGGARGGEESYLDNAQLPIAHMKKNTFLEGASKIPTLHHAPQVDVI